MCHFLLHVAVWLAVTQHTMCAANFQVFLEYFRYVIAIFSFGMITIFMQFGVVLCARSFQKLGILI